MHYVFTCRTTGSSGYFTSKEQLISRLKQFPAGNRMDRVRVIGFELGHTDEALFRLFAEPGEGATNMATFYDSAKQRADFVHRLMDWLIAFAFGYLQSNDSVSDHVAFNGPIAMVLVQLEDLEE